MAQVKHPWVDLTVLDVEVLYVQNVDAIQESDRSVILAVHTYLQIVNMFYN